MMGMCGWDMCADFDMEMCEAMPFCDWTDAGCVMSSFGDDGGWENSCSNFNQEECEYLDFCEWIADSDNPNSFGMCVEVGPGGDGGGTGGGEVVGRNVLSAEKFGALELLLPEGPQLVLSTGPTVRRLRHRLRNFNDDDYKRTSGTLFKGT